MAQAGVIAAAPAAVAHREATVFRIRLVTVICLLVAWEGLAALGSLEILYGDVIPSSWKIVFAIWNEITAAASAPAPTA